MDDVAVDSEEIRARAGELAARLGVGAPQVRAGDVPEWIAEGARVKLERKGTVLVVGSGFHEHSPAEREAVLASVLVIADLYRNARWKPFMVLPVVFVLALPAGYFTGLQGIPSGPVMVAAAALGLLSYFAAFMVWGRQLTYRHDRRVAESMGREAVERLLGLDERKRRELRGWPRMYVRLLAPTESRRAERLGVLLGRA
ncbi:hypothetical protein [Nocardia sp. NPDC048505]|uniref:hypothetical protein n=1 Tax=unclassified Nocardia TaxID=2637762 RepID=UPI0033FBC237